MTIEQYIKTEMADCPLTEQQEEKLLIAFDKYLTDLEKTPVDVSKPFYCWDKEAIGAKKCEVVCDVCKDSSCKPN